MLYSVTASLYACRAKATLFSVEVSSSVSCIMFWLALGRVDSTRANRRPGAGEHPRHRQVLASPPASPGLAAACCEPLTAWLRAWITASSVSARAHVALGRFDQVGNQVVAPLQLHSIWEKAFLKRFLSVTSRL